MTEAEAADFPVFQMDDLIAEVIRFRPAEVLVACRSSALAIAQNGPMINVEVPSSITGRNRRTAIKVMAYSPALIARISILKGSPLAIGTLNENAFLRLLWMVAMLWEGTTDLEELRLRATYEQWWSQENLGRSIGRALLFYQDIPGMLEGPAFDVRGEVEQALGLTIEDYVGTAFQLFALAMSHEQTPFFYPTTIRSTVGSQWAKGLLSAQNINVFLGTFSASVERFKELAGDGQALERYAFNPLFQAPLIEVPGSGCIAPIPDLLIWRVEDAPYWELRNKFKGEGKANQFATFFGKEVFERYVGLQLAAHFGEENVLSEQAYNGKLGPDWIVRIGTLGLAVECTIGSLAIAARSGFDLDALRTGLKERYVARLNELPKKVQELTAARSDLELEGVTEWHYALVWS